jgi:hypothetical protein
MIKWDSGHEMMADVGADDVVEEMSVDETEVAVDSGGSTAGEGPGVIAVVGEGAVGVLEEGNCHCEGMRISKPVGEGKKRWENKGCDELWDEY